jgi:hypothetical protein
MGKNESGVIQVVIVLLLIVVLGVAAGAVAMYNKNSHRAVVTSASPTVSAAVTAAPTPSGSPSNELRITGMGFKLTLPSGLAGLQYSEPATSSGTVGGTTYTVTTIKLASGALVQADGSHCGPSDGPLGLISKYSFDPTGKFNDQGYIKKVGNFYLMYSGGAQGYCSMTASVQETQTSQTQLMRQAFDTATSL